MSVFDKKSPSNTAKTTEGFSFGKSNSENEDSYKKSDNTLFDDYLDILPKIGEGCFIITGRKGSGKSAIAKYIKDNATFENNEFCEIVRSDTIKLEKHIQKSSTDSEELLVSFFQWLILVKLVKLILESKNGKYTPELKALNNFVKSNRGIVDIDKFAISEVTAMNKRELNFGAFFNVAEFKGIMERIVGKRMERAPYYKLLPALKEIVYKILSFNVFEGYQFIVIFDDLDVEFRLDNHHDKKSLMELIRTANEFNNDLRKYNNTKILILLRDDVKKALIGFDATVSKIFSSGEVELKWYDDIDDSKTLLRELVNRRIALNFKRMKRPYNEHDPWETLFKDNEGCYSRNGNKPAFKYILEYTFLRPRDIILFLKHVGLKKYPYPIKGDTVGSLLRKYAQENEIELQGELAINYSQEEIQTIFQVLKDLSDFQRDGYDRLFVIEKLSNRGLKDEVFQTLVDYYLLNPFDPKTDHLYLKYREDDPSKDGLGESDLKYKLHKCIYALYNSKATIPYGYWL